MCRSYSGSEMVADISPGFVVVFGGLLLLLSFPQRRTPGEEHWRAETCSGCGYELFGLEREARCPECGLDGARMRTVNEATSLGFEVYWMRGAAFAVLCCWVLLAGWIRYEVMETMYASVVDRKDSHVDYDRDYAMGWAVAPMVLGWIVTWIAGKSPNRLLKRSIWIGSILFGAVVAQAFLMDPTQWGGDLHVKGTVLAYLVLPAAGLGAWLAPEIMDRIRARTDATEGELGEVEACVPESA